MEGAVRPCAARWLDQHAIAVWRTSGTLEFQPDYRQSRTTLYRKDLGTGALLRIPHTRALLAIGEERYELIRGVGHTFALPGQLPPGFPGLGVCIARSEGSYVLAARTGEVWTCTDGENWERAGRLSLTDITAGCALGDDLYLFASARGEAEVVRTSPFTTVTRQGLHADAIQAAVPLPDGRVATVSRDRALRVWQLTDSLRLDWSITDLHEHFVNCAALTDDVLWTGSSDGTIAAVSLSSHDLIRRVKIHADAVRSLDLVPEGGALLTVSDDGTYAIYDPVADAVVHRYGEPRQYIRCGRVSFRGNAAPFLFFGTTAGVLHYGELGRDLRAVKLSETSLRALCELGNGEIVCGDDNGVLWLFDLEGGHSAGSASTGAGITVIRTDPRDGSLLCGYRDGYVRRFSAAAVESLRARARSAGESSSQPVLLTPHVLRHVHESIVGDLVADTTGLVRSCSDDQTIKLLAADALSPLRTTQLDSAAVNNLL